MSIPEVEDWTQLIQLMGQYAGTPTLVAVDAAGNIIAIMKGEYGGALKTLATDAGGRLIAILTDPEDISGVFRQMGLAELASRLGYPGTCDRRGDLLWFTTFENGLQGALISSDHADSKGYLSTNRALHGAYSVRLDPRGAANAYVNWSRVFHWPVAGRLGVELALSTDTNPLYVTISMFYYDGTDYWLGRIRYDPATGNWLIIPSSGVNTVILAGFYLQQGPSAWHAIKLVIDVDTKEYVRVVIGRNSIDLSAYDLYTAASAAIGQLEIRIQCDASAAMSEAIHIDGVIITQNEP